MELLEIFIPNNNINERSYIIQTLFYDFLGLSYELKISTDIKDYVIYFKNKTITIKDGFFNKHVQELSYLNINNIPEKVAWFDSTPIGPGKIPMIFGTQFFRINENFIECGLDIFASSFFMLSRWEELLIGKDVFKRSNESVMYVVRNNLYKDPIVNEYCSLLVKFLGFIKFSDLSINRKFRVLLTHDIDFLFRYASFGNFIKNLAGDLLHRNSIKLFISTISGYIKYQRNQIKDPFDTFNEFMDFSQQFGFKDYFYFKPSIRGEYDCTYNIFDPRIKKIIQNIIQRGNEVGIHPSLNTHQNEAQFKIEVQRIRSLGAEINGGRQHYLLYDISQTFIYWDNILDYDCGLGFYDHTGFRSGCCYEYNIFDVKGRKKLNIKEIPLIVMDVAAIMEMTSKSLSSDNLYKDIIALADTVHKYSGNFVFLWHNDNLYRDESKKYRQIYFDVVRYLGNLN